MILGALAYFVLHSAGSVGIAIMILVFVMLGLVFFAAIFIGSFMTVGYVLTFIQAYALYFLGGRNPKVGEYLAPFWPQPPYTFTPPQPPPAFNPPAV